MIGSEKIPSHLYKGNVKDNILWSMSTPIKKEHDRRRFNVKLRYPYKKPDIIENIKTRILQLTGYV